MEVLTSLCGKATDAEAHMTTLANFTGYEVLAVGDLVRLTDEHYAQLVDVGFPADLAQKLQVCFLS